MKFLTFLFLVISSSASAKAFFHTGDVILQPLDCYLCSMIEAEESTPYSHIGLVVVDRDNQIRVIESYKKVAIVSLGEFLSKTEVGQKPLVIRTYETFNQKNFTHELLNFYYTKFDALPYDPEFSMDDEKLYCSELVMKILNPFLSVKIPTKKMHFDHNRSAWESYFRGKVPDGAPGIAPADFLRSGLFYVVGEIN